MDFKLELIAISTSAVVLIPVQCSKLPDLAKLLPPIIGLACTLPLATSIKHELSEHEKDISDRYDGLDIREEELNQRDHRIYEAEKTSQLERQRKQAELNSKIQSINDLENDIRKREQALDEILEARIEVISGQIELDLNRRREELEQQYNRKFEEIQTWYKNQKIKLEEYKEDINRSKSEVVTEYAIEKSRYERQLANHQLEIQKLNQLIKILKAPKLATGGDEIAREEANKVIRFLWQQDKPIEVDCADRQPKETGDNETRFWVRLRDTTHFQRLKSKEIIEAIRIELAKNTDPVITQEESETLIRITLPWNNRSPKANELTRKSVEESLKDCLSVGNERSWLITGHPGSGKTSVMIYLGQQLGGETAQRLALNPHKDDFSAYEPYGFVEVNNMDEIIQNIYLLKEELRLRREVSNRRFKLVVAVDELGAILDACDKPKEIMAILRQCSIEGRKLGLNVVIGHHSQTTKAIEMDGEFRNSFYQLFLVGAARYAIDQPGRSVGLQSQEEYWVKKAAYPALMLINWQYSLIKHPTHGDYQEYRDKGNAPKNLHKWLVNPITIAEHISTESKPPRTLTQGEIDMIYILAGQAKTISQIVSDIWRVNPNKSDQYKMLKNQVEQVLDSFKS
jgi:hypothetical protein